MDEVPLNAKEWISLTNENWGESMNIGVVGRIGSRVDPKHGPYWGRDDHMETQLWTLGPGKSQCVRYLI